MRNWKNIQHVLENTILPEITLFVWTRRNDISTTHNIVKGEFFTLLRRHLPSLINYSHGCTHQITKHNIDKIYIRNGTIQYLTFIKNYNGTYDSKTIDQLNDILDNIKFNFSDSIFKSSINKIITNIQNI